MTLPYQRIRAMTEGSSPIISAGVPFTEVQFQPASFDCRLGPRAHRMSSSFLPKRGEKIADIIAKKTLYSFDLKPGTVLERNASYLIPLAEKLRLPAEIQGASSPKSSIGRIDVFVRLLADEVTRFDSIPAGYHGPLYLEVIPLTFPIAVEQGLKLNQLRFRINDPKYLADAELKLLQSQYGIVYDDAGKVYPENEMFVSASGLFLHVDLSNRGIIGFRTKANPSEVIDLSKVAAYEPDRFWEPIEKPKDGEIVLVPDTFYILTTKERVAIPPDYAAEILSYDPGSGELRSHYAGFFDPGFGYGTDKKPYGTTAVLEVRAHNVPFRLTDGQVICQMVFERLTETPVKIYGDELASNYLGQGPKLAKYFKKSW